MTCTLKSPPKMASFFLSSLVLMFIAALILLPQGLAAYKLTPTYKPPDSELPPYRNFVPPFSLNPVYNAPIYKTPNSPPIYNPPIYEAPPTYKPSKKRLPPPFQKLPPFYKQAPPSQKLPRV